MCISQCLRSHMLQIVINRVVRAFRKFEATSVPFISKDRNSIASHSHLGLGLLGGILLQVFPDNVMCVISHTLYLLHLFTVLDIITHYYLVIIETEW